MPRGRQWLRGAFAALREGRIGLPAQTVRVPDGEMISRYDEVRCVLEQPGLFSASVLAEAEPVMLGADGAAHASARRLVAKLLDPATLDALAAVAKREARHALAPRFDLDEDFAGPVSLAVAAELTGLSMSEVDRISHSCWKGIHGPQARWSDHFSEILDRAPVARRVLAQGQGSIGPAEARSLTALLCMATVRTTQQALASAALAIIANKECQAAAHGGETVSTAFLHELLRLQIPDFDVRRIALADCQIGEKTIARGSILRLNLREANRDEAHFTQPDRFAPGTRPGAHLSFGRGPHQCIGKGLALRVMAAALAPLIERADRLEPVDPGAVQRWIKTGMRGPLPEPLLVRER